MKVGDRVGAVANIDGVKVFLLGFGVYVGDETPTDAAGGTAEFARALGAKNPKILLDNGKVVWGCECWWGSEAGLKKEMEGKEVIEVDIDVMRSEFSVKH